MIDGGAAAASGGASASSWRRLGCAGSSCARISFETRGRSRAASAAGGTAGSGPSTQPSLPAGAASVRESVATSRRSRELSSSVTVTSLVWKSMSATQQRNRPMMSVRTRSTVCRKPREPARWSGGAISLRRNYLRLTARSARPLRNSAARARRAVRAAAALHDLVADGREVRIGGPRRRLFRRVAAHNFCASPTPICLAAREKLAQRRRRRS